MRLGGLGVVRWWYAHSAVMTRWRWRAPGRGGRCTRRARAPRRRLHRRVSPVSAGRAIRCANAVARPHADQRTLLFKQPLENRGGASTRLPCKLRVAGRAGSAQLMRTLCRNAAPQHPNMVHPKKVHPNKVHLADDSRYRTFVAAVQADAIEHHTDDGRARGVVCAIVVAHEVLIIVVRVRVCSGIASPSSFNSTDAKTCSAQA